MTDAGLCQCGCGRDAPISTYTNARLGYRRGQPVRFIVGHNQCASNNSRWNGGLTKTKGYIVERSPGHPRSGVRGYVPQHVLVAERALGRYLPLKAEVHHVNAIRHDNRGCNLVVCEDHGFHMLLHQRARAFSATGNPKARKCVYCSRWSLDLRVRGRKAYHLPCAAAYMRAYTARKEGMEP